MLLPGAPVAEQLARGRVDKMERAAGWTPYRHVRFRCRRGRTVIPIFGHLNRIGRFMRRIWRRPRLRDIAEDYLAFATGGRPVLAVLQRVLDLPCGPAFALRNGAHLGAAADQHMLGEIVSAGAMTMSVSCLQFSGRSRSPGKICQREPSASSTM